MQRHEGETLHSLCILQQGGMNRATRAGRCQVVCLCERDGRAGGGATLVKAGQHVVAGDDIYGGTSRLLAQVAPGLGIDVTNMDTTDIQ